MIFPFQCPFSARIFPAMLEDTGGYPHCLPVLTHGIHVSFSVDQIIIQSLLFL